MFDQFAHVIAFALFGMAFVAANVAILSRFLRPKVKDAVKEAIKEVVKDAILHAELQRKAAAEPK